MARRRADDEVIDLLVVLPWWVSLVFAVLVYVLLSFVLPPLFTGNLLLGGLAMGLKPLAPYFALLFAALAPVAYLKSLHRRRLLDSQTGLDSIRAMSWQQFEILVGEGFRRQKYAVEERGGAHPTAAWI